MIDMSFMKGLDHRDTDLFKRYGAKVYFDENQMVTAIYDCDAEELVKPGDYRSRAFSSIALYGRK